MILINVYDGFVSWVRLLLKFTFLPQRFTGLCIERAGWVGGGGIPIESNASSPTSCCHELGSWEVEGAGWAQVGELVHQPQGISSAANSPHPPLCHPHQICECGLILSLLYDCDFKNCVYSCTCIHHLS